MAKTLGTVRTAVLYRLGDASQVVWTEAEITRYLNDGQRLLVSLTRILWTYTYLNDVIDTALATLPADFIEADRVTWNWAKIPMLTAAELRRIDVLYKTNKGPVRAYTLEEDGTGKLRKWLVPSVTATAGQDVNNTRLEYFRLPTTMSAAGDAFSVSDRCVKYLESYAMYRAFERKGMGQNPKAAQHYRARFEEGVQRLLARRRRVQTACVPLVVGGSPPVRSHLATPRLPWNFGKVVRWYR